MEDSSKEQAVNASLKQRLSRHTRLAWFWLFWERYTPVFLLALLAISVFLIGVFMGVWERLGDPFRGFGVIATLYILVIATYRAQKRKLPSHSEARRRYERDSHQAHRPLDVLDDSPAIGKDNWELHYAKALAQSKRLKRPKLIPSIAPHDRYYLRFIMPCLLVAALVFGSGSNMERLRQTFSPEWKAGINPNDVSFEAWINPPNYTGRPPLYFKGQEIEFIPAGSEWVARMNGTKSSTRPKLLQGSKDRYLNVTALGANSFEARATLNQSSRAIWTVGPNRKIWDLNVVADRAPIITIDDVPEADKQDRLTLTYSFTDDYGVTELRLQMAEIKSGDADPFANPSYVNVPLSGGSLPKAESVMAKLDLTRHPLAGKKVVARLVATDGAQQTGLSEKTYFRVPDKIFVEPMAKAIVEQRNLILAGLEAGYKAEPKLEYRSGLIYDTYDPENRMGRASEKVQRAALLIEAVTDRPEGVFSDPSVYLGLRNVRSRLRYGRNAEILKPIPDELWSIALRAEFGVLGTALEEMREAEQALREGMARRAPQREVDTLFERYNNAVDAYTEELRRKAMEEGNFAEEEQGGAGGGGLQSANEIKELLKAIEEANKAGDVEGARRALARLAQVLENMEIQLSRSGGSGDGDGLQGAMSEEMKKNLEELADLLGEQRELQDETEEAQRQENQQDSQEGPNQNSTEDDGNETLSPGELAARQEELEQLLNRLGEEAGNSAQMGANESDQSAGDSNSENGADQGEGTAGQPGDNGDQTAGTQSGDGDSKAGAESATESAQEQLSRAQSAMAGAAEALSNGDLAGAGDAQSEAIQALREAGEAMAEAALEQSSGEQARAGDTDPLGRENGGVESENSEADIDQRDNATRSRELIEDLRRRSSEQERAKEERDYLERLLKRF